MPNQGSSDWHSELTTARSIFNCCYAEFPIIYPHKKINLSANCNLRDTIILRQPIGKLLARRIQIFWVRFYVIIFWPLIFKASKNMAPTKRNSSNLDLPHQIFVCQGLRPFWGTSNQWQIIFLVSLGSPANLSAINNIVLMRTSNSLVQNIVFCAFSKILNRVLALRS